MLLRIEPRPDQVLGEIGGCGDTDQAANPRRSGKGCKQHDPASHARPDEDLLPLGQRIENRDRVLRPAANGAQAEIAGRCAVAEIVEAQIGLSAALAIILQEQCLSAGHVGAEATQEHNARAGTGKTVVSDCRAIAA